MLDRNDRFDIQLYWIYRLLLGKGDVAIDVGANQGAHTAIMAEAVGSTGAVFAFEPIPMLFHGLRARFKDRPFVNVLPLAISDTDETATFFVNTTNFSFCSGLRNQDEFTRGTSLSMEIGTRRIDSLEFLKPSSIRLVKFDVEGAELLALKGASETFRRARPVCVFEWGDAVADAYGARAGDMWTFWREHAYSLCDVRGMPIKSQDGFVKSSALQDVWNYVAVPNESPALGDRISADLRAIWAGLDDTTVDRRYGSHARWAFPKPVLTFGSPYEEDSIELHLTNQSSFAWLDLADGFYEDVPSRDRFPSPVRIGLRWFTRDGGYVTEERRSLGVAGVLPGEEISANVPVYPYAGFTFLAPGEYRLTIGLVHENITWFRDKGDHEVTLRVRISGAGFAGATAK
jgi:FkbM family methyltransferase